MYSRLMADKPDMQSESLTPKQQAFVREYLIDLNATQAAIRAGYSADTARQMGSENLSKPVIQEAIGAAMSERAKRTEISADYVLYKIKETVERCSQAEPVMEWNADAKTMMETGEWKFEHNGVLKGCELLGKHLKLFTDKHEHTGADGKPLMPAESDEQLDAKLAALLAKVVGNEGKDPGSE